MLNNVGTCTLFLFAFLDDLEAARESAVIIKLEVDFNTSYHPLIHLLGYLYLDVVENYS